MENLKLLIETAYQDRDQDTTLKNTKTITAIKDVIQHLDAGTLRVAEKKNGLWQVNSWVKEAILLGFRISENQVSATSTTNYYDKIPLKYKNYTAEQFYAEKTRVVPHATVRQGCYIGENVVLMPSYVNIGAFIDTGTMIDTWATVGSCAQIGKNCHISGGAGIGGVLEPLQATPTIIEDNCFIGARSEVVEGVIVEEGAVIGMGVFIGQSTKIYDRDTGEIYQGRVPARSVVVSGSLPGHNNQYHLNCAVIVKKVDAKTRSKTAINELLRY